MDSESSADSSWIDDVADRFERDWRSGRAPRIEDYLTGATGHRRSRLFEELLRVERELRRRQGDRAEPEEYHHRFPDLAAVIARNFAECVESSGASTFDMCDSPGLVQGSPRPGTPTEPRFRVLHHHADGGIGRVSVAFDEELRRRVALKELQDRFADDPQKRACFLLEAELTGRLEHPGVIPIYSAGCDRRGRPFYAMRLIDGEDLGQAIKGFHAADARSGRDPGERALALRQLLRRFVDVCNVVAYAHSRGVLHRDLKPGNVMLGPYGETLVVDWGMALGTIPYMSPEQANGWDSLIGTASDVYNLGATLYHIVVGRAPIEGAHREEMLSAARRAEFAPPRRLNSKVPAALEAICLKAMKHRPADRYASPRALADDIEHWLADEPVSAWKEPWPVRIRRWVARHRTAVTSCAAALVVATVALGYLVYESQLRLIQRRAQADGLVVALGTAEVGAVRGIIDQLHPLRPLVLERLRSMARPGAPEATSTRRNAALALLPDDPSQAEYLMDRLLQEDVRPAEIAVIRQALIDHGQAPRLTPRLWTLLAERRGACGPNLGAAGALALFAPRDPRWVALGPPIATELMAKGPLLIGDWRYVFQPVQRQLIGPLRAILGDASRPRERALAATLLLAFAAEPGNPARDDDLAEMVPDADPEEFRAILRSLGDRRNAVAVLLPKLEGGEATDELTARRRGRVAAALITLGAPERAWPLLRRTQDDDPGARTELIHDLAAYAVPVGDVASRLMVEADISARRALILALGEYPPAGVAAETRHAAEERLRDLYANDGDPGVHSAIEWLFRRRWDLGQALDAIQKSSPGRGVSPRRGWFVNGVDEMMAVMPVAAGGEFLMGSPESEGGRDSDESLHWARLARRFAIATREVTAAQFARFLASESAARPVDAENPPSSSCPDCPVVGVDWLAAAAYCNWVSRCERLPPYYDIKESTLLIPDRNGIGYRLPTEREWEFACRAEARTSRPHGASEARLGDFAWFLPNAAMHVQPVGQLKPNDFGLFDILGNAFEWTEDRYLRHNAAATVRPMAEEPDSGKGGDELEVVLRGGGFSSPATLLRSAYRERSLPSNPLGTYGFRYVRTLPTERTGDDRDQ